MKVGNVIKFKPEWSDSSDDGEFVVIRVMGDRMVVQTLDHCKDFVIKPISTVLCDWAVFVRESV